MSEHESHARSVSCVIATNRTSPHLTEALRSAAAQTAGLLEIIVVDDGAPDSAAIEAAVAEVAEATLIRIAHSGVSAARNAGVRAASGAWIAFLDDDDRWDSTRLERQLADLSQRPGAVVGYCGLRTISVSGTELVAGEHIQVDGRADVLRRRTGILAGNTIISRAAFDAVGGFDESLRLAEDLDLILRLAGCGDFVLTPADLVDYRLHEANSTGRYRELSKGIKGVLATHAVRARDAGDAEAVAALRASQRANDRYAWWSASRAARAAGGARHPVATLGHYAWACRFAPLAPIDAAWRRRPG